jgi:hypothetical protein
MQGGLSLADALVPRVTGAAHLLHVIDNDANFKFDTF